MLQLLCWKGCAEQAWTCRMWAHLVMEATAHGDVAIGIWLGEQNRNRDGPAVAHQLHTAMLGAD